MFTGTSPVPSRACLAIEGVIVVIQARVTRPRNIPLGHPALWVRCTPQIELLLIHSLERADRFDVVRLQNVGHVPGEGEHVDAERTCVVDNEHALVREA